MPNRKYRAKRKVGPRRTGGRTPRKTTTPPKPTGMENTITEMASAVPKKITGGLTPRTPVRTRGSTTRSRTTAPKRKTSRSRTARLR